VLAGGSEWTFVSGCPGGHPRGRLREPGSEQISGLAEFVDGTYLMMNLSLVKFRAALATICPVIDRPRAKVVW